VDRPDRSNGATCRKNLVKSNSVFKRFRRWVLAGVFTRIFNALSDDADFEYGMIEGTICKVHRHGQGAKGGPKIRPLAKAKAA